MKRNLAILGLAGLLTALLLTGCASPVKEAQAAIDAIGTVTLDSEDAIAAAEAQWDALTEEQRSQVENADLLEAARESYTRIRGTCDAIDAIGTVTAESGDAIDAARRAYDALDDTQRAAVTNLAVLQAAETAFAALPQTVELTTANIEDYFAITWDTSSEEVSDRYYRDTYFTVTVDFALRRTVESMDSVSVTMTFDFSKDRRSYGVFEATETKTFYIPAMTGVLQDTVVIYDSLAATNYYPYVTLDNVTIDDVTGTITVLP